MSLTLYIGSYTDGTASNGIYRAEFDPDTGTLGPAILAGACRQPSFLVPDRDRGRLYAVRETDAGTAEAEPAVAAWARGPNGDLARLASSPAGGGAPCHLALAPDGRHLWCANYSGGSVGIHGLEGGAGVWGPCDLIRHRGSGPVEERQEGAHPHSATFTPDGEHVMVADLGSDTLHVYRPGIDGNDLVVTCTLEAGSGPRHMVFHPDGRYVYVVGELDSSVTVLAWSTGPARLRPVGRVSTIAAELAGDNLAADIHIHPSGTTLYVSNRGHDNLAVFALANAGARLEPAGHAPAGGTCPRNFLLTPDGDWMLVANKDSDNLAVFHLPPRTILPKPVGATCAAPAPSCLVLW